MTVRVVTAGRELRAARRLHAVVYLEKRYVEPEDVVDGLLSPTVDPWVDSSTYFVARNTAGTLVGVSRQIHSPCPSTLPALRLHGLRSELTAQLGRQPSGSVVEISALAVSKAAPEGTATALYSSMWHHGLTAGHSAWVMSVHPGVFRLLVSGLGPVLEPFGPTQWFMGSDVVPSVAWTDTLSPTIARHAAGLADRRRARVLPSLFPPTAVRRLS